MKENQFSQPIPAGWFAGEGLRSEAAQRLRRNVIGIFGIIFNIQKTTLVYIE